MFFLENALDEVDSLDTMSISFSSLIESLDDESHLLKESLMLSEIENKDMEIESVVNESIVDGAVNTEIRIIGRICEDIAKKYMGFRKYALHTERLFDAVVLRARKYALRHKKEILSVKRVTLKKAKVLINQGNTPAFVGIDNVFSNMKKFNYKFADVNRSESRSSYDENRESKGLRQSFVMKPALNVEVNPKDAYEFVTKVRKHITEFRANVVATDKLFTELRRAGKESLKVAKSKRGKTKADKAEIKKMKKRLAVSRLAATSQIIHLRAEERVITRGLKDAVKTMMLAVKKSK